LPDEIEGEVVAVVVEKKERASISSSELQNTVREQLGSSSTPKVILDLRHDLEQENVPQTSSGKVRKEELKNIVSAVLHKRRESNPGNPTTENTAEQLTNIWAQVLYRSTLDFSPEASLEGNVDSLSSIRFCSLVGRQLKKKITIKDLKDHVTIAAQAQLLNSRATAAEPTGRAKRTGPPDVDDKCFEGNEARLQECKAMANELLRPLGLDWQSDVQDIIPVNPWGSVLMKRLQPQSWNHRQSYYAPNVGADTLKRAIKSALRQHDMLRTLAIQTCEKQQYQLVVRACPNWFEQMIRTGFRVETAENLKRLHLDDPELDFAAFPGPLFRLSIATIDAGGAGIVINANHSCFDALSIEMFLEDLDVTISKERGLNISIDTSRDSFKELADALSVARGKGTLQAEVEQAASRLHGISKYANTLWPKQRAPEWFKGNDTGWSHSDGRPGLPDERPKLNGPEHAGVYGISRSMQTPARCAFALPVLFKAALSLFNMIQTSSSRAVFCQFEAGRHWPARHDSTEGTALADPLNIVGPTYQAVITSSELKIADTIKSFLQRLQDEQESLSSTAHAPLDAIKTELRKNCKDGSSGHHDAEVINHLLRRQVFNWLPPTRRDFKEIEVVQVTSRSDVGILWNFRAEKGEVSVNASYDDAQLRYEEVEKSIGVMFRVARYLIDNMEGEAKLLEMLEGWEIDEEFLVHER
jgi:acyl carrier protein